MSLFIVLPSKKRVDTKTVTLDFSQYIDAGDSISSVSNICEVFTGFDVQPEIVLKGLPTFLGTIVKQDVQLGIPGVIYSIIYAVITTNGFTVELVTRLAVLIDVAGANPNLAPFFLSSKPYPISYIEELSVSFLPLGGDLRRGGIETSFLDSLDLEIEPISGGLRNAFKSTNYLEGLDLDIEPISGNLRNAVIPTNYLEALNLSIEPTEGLLRDALVSNAYTEELDLTILPTGGSLYVP